MQELFSSNSLAPNTGKWTLNGHYYSGKMLQKDSFEPLCEKGEKFKLDFFTSEGQFVDNFQTAWNTWNYKFDLPLSSRAHLLLCAIKSGDVRNMIYMFKSFNTPPLNFHDTVTNENAISMAEKSRDCSMLVLVKNLIEAQNQNIYGIIDKNLGLLTVKEVLKNEEWELDSKNSSLRP